MPKMSVSHLNVSVPLNTSLGLLNGHPFCFCYNFVTRDQILVIFGSLVAKETCNRPLLTYLKEIAGALR